MTDCAVIRHQEREAAREQEIERKRKAAARKHKGKQPRINYRTMNLIEYSAMRQRNWFDEPRDQDIENRHFWCKEQLGIYEDVYSQMNIRPMRPLDMAHLRKKSVFEVPLDITQKMGLHHLMSIQCHYHEYYVQQFFSTLAFKSDEAITMVWLTGEEECEANFYDFAEVLGYEFTGNNEVG